MSPTEKDLRDALDELDRRAVEHGAPSTESIVAHTSVEPLSHYQRDSARRIPRWLPPLAAAAVVAAAGVTATLVATGDGGPSHQRAPHAGGSLSPASSTASRPSPTSPPTPRGTRRTAPKVAPPPPAPSSTGTSAHSSPPTSTSGTRTVAVGILADAASKLDTLPPSRSPGANEFYYRKTTDSVSWTSVSGRKPGKGHNSEGLPEGIPGCRHGHFVGGGTSGSCTLNDVPHYLADAPTTPSDWDRYLEQLAPGSKAAGAQGKTVVGVLHEDLTTSMASAALLRYVESCPGLHTVKTQPVAGEQLVGVTCTSMTNGSYGLAFDAPSHAFVGFVPVDYQTGGQDSPAEIVHRTAVVKAVGDKP